MPHRIFGERQLRNSMFRLLVISHENHKSGHQQWQESWIDQTGYLLKDAEHFKFPPRHRGLCLKWPSQNSDSNPTKNLFQYLKLDGWKLCQIELEHLCLEVLHFYSFLAT